MVCRLNSDVLIGGRNPNKLERKQIRIPGEWINRIRLKQMTSPSQRAMSEEIQ